MIPPPHPNEEFVSFARVNCINSYPANWSVEKVKKEAKKDYKYFHGVADLREI